MNKNNLIFKSMEFINNPEFWRYFRRDDDQIYWDSKKLTSLQQQQKATQSRDKYLGKVLKIEFNLHDCTSDSVVINMPNLVLITSNTKTSIDYEKVVRLEFKYDLKSFNNMLIFSKGEFVEVIGEIQAIGKPSDLLVSLQLISIKKIAHPIPPKKGCYLTTACVEAMLLSDDCYELQTLRRFRDSYIAQKPNGLAMIGRYYETAPNIIIAINSTGDGRDILKGLFKKIEEVVTMIDNQKLEDAYQLYCELSIKLEQQYLN